MNKFTYENTNGFDEKTLDEMNKKLRTLLVENNVRDDDDTLQKHYEEIVFNEYC